MLSITKRNYTMADADLIVLSDGLLSNAMRDLTDLAPFGVTTQSILATQAMCDDFSNYPIDDELTGLMGVANRDKNLKREELCDSIRGVMTRFQNKYGANAPELKVVAANSVSTMSDNELARCGDRVVRRATEKLTELAGNGLTQAILDALHLTSNEFSVAINHHYDAVKERDLNVDTRIKKGNLLYAALVIIANNGKTKYKKVNEAKHNDYVIKHTSHIHIQNVSGSVQANSIGNPGISSLDGNETIAIQNLGGADMIAYFGLNPNDEPSGMNIVTVTFGPSITYTLAQLGFNKTTAPRLLLKNNSNAHVSYLVQVEA